MTKIPSRKCHQWKKCWKRFKSFWGVWWTGWKLKRVQNLWLKIWCLNSVFSFKTRMQKDGRQPQTLRLTIRRYTATNKWFNRESRQAPIPNHIAQKIASGKICQTKLHIKSVQTSFKGLLGIKSIWKTVFCDIFRLQRGCCGTAGPAGYETLS